MHTVFVYELVTWLLVGCRNIHPTRCSDVYSGNSNRRRCRRIVFIGSYHNDDVWRRPVDVRERPLWSLGNPSQVPHTPIPARTREHEFSVRRDTRTGALAFWKKAFWIKQFSTLSTDNNRHVTLFYERVARVLINVKSISVIV